MIFKKNTYINKFDRNGSCAIQGEKSENGYKNILISRGFIVRDATLAEQLKHIDLFVNYNGVEVGFEIKARKKINRSDSSFQDSLVWIEIKNVNGDDGWLFGQANYIVFEREKDFIVIDREKLVSFVMSTCDFTKTVCSAKEALYCNYQRKGRRDSITLIKNIDIESLAKKIVKK